MCVVRSLALSKSPRTKSTELPPSSAGMAPFRRVALGSRGVEVRERAAFGFGHIEEALLLQDSRIKRDCEEMCLASVCCTYGVFFCGLRRCEESWSLSFLDSEFWQVARGGSRFSFVFDVVL